MQVNIISNGVAAFRYNLLMRQIDERRVSGGSVFLAEDPDKLAAALKTATEWYEQLLPENTFTCPESIEQSESYQYANIESVLNQALQLNIDYENEPYLLWIARMATCFPLPPLWRKKEYGCAPIFYNIEYEVISEDHPSQHFLREYVKKARIASETYAKAIFSKC